MRVALQRVPGVNLDISSLDRQSLARQGINDVVSGRGPGVVAVFGSERTKELFEWCRARSVGGPRLVLDGHVIPGSEERGLRQFLADLAQLLTEVSPTGQVVGGFL